MTFRIECGNLKCERDDIMITTRNDVNKKIWKLEADTHKLFLNLKNLQKNRAKLTNEAVALTQELEEPTNESNRTEEAVKFKQDCIHVLLDPKNIQERHNDCCTICTCSECEDTRELTEDIELKDLEESLRNNCLSTEENEVHDCCCVCSKNGCTASEYIDEDAIAVASGARNESNFSGSNEKCCLCSTCSIEERSCRNNRKFCEFDDHRGHVTNKCSCNVVKTKQRCRGGMDRVRSKHRSAASNTVGSKNQTKKIICDGCECDLCDRRNFDGESPPCLGTCESFEKLCDCDDDCTNDELVVSSGDAPVKLQQICKVEKLREVLEELKNRNHALRKMLNDCSCTSRSAVNILAPEISKNDSSNDRGKTSEFCDSTTRSMSGLIMTVKLLQKKCRTKDGMILTLAEALKKLASPEQTDRILTKLANPCTDDSPIRDLDRSELWKFLHDENSFTDARSNDRESLDSGRQNVTEEECDNEDSSKCRCASYDEIFPPRELRIVGRIGLDTLVITWKPPKSGSVDAYEIFVDEQLVARLRTPLRRTETVMRNLDLTSPRLIEIIAIDPTGNASPTIEKLFDPVRFERSRTR